ncbi:MAG: hypothetical protein AB9907_17530 [Flexilinea sp.]
MINLILLIIGDLAVCALEGFYMGVGIRESAGLVNIIGMTIPTFIFWMIFAWLLRIYVRIPAIQREAGPSGARPDKTEKPLPGFNQIIRTVVSAQRIFRLWNRLAVDQSLRRVLADLVLGPHSQI